MLFNTRSFVWFSDSRRDLVHAARLLRRNPILTITATLSLAIGIGANTTIFTVASALLLRPAEGVAEPSRLVDIGSSRGGVGFGPISYPNYLDIRQRATTLEGIYAYSRFPQAMSVGGAGLNVDTIFGIRIALGAQTAAVIGMVLREGAALTLIGSAIGVLLAAALSNVLAGFLFGIPPVDPLTFAATTMLFAAIGLAACYMPVRRATQIHPTQALRYE